MSTPPSVTPRAHETQPRAAGPRVHRPVTGFEAAVNQGRAAIVRIAGPLGSGNMRAVSDIALLHVHRRVAVMPNDVVQTHDPM